MPGEPATGAWLEQQLVRLGRVEGPIRGLDRDDVLDAARDRGVRKVVFISSSAVYGIPRTVPVDEETHPKEPIGAYGRSKLDAEVLCRRAVEEGLLDPKRVVQIGIRGSLYKRDDNDWAIEQGMLTLRMDGWLKIMKGVVPLEQVLRETSA